MACLRCSKNISALNFIEKKLDIERSIILAWAGTALQCQEGEMYIQNIEILMSFNFFSLYELEMGQFLGILFPTNCFLIFSHDFYIRRKG
jgi:hypothetical protein